MRYFSLVLASIMAWAFVFYLLWQSDNVEMKTVEWPTIVLIVAMMVAQGLFFWVSFNHEKKKKKGGAHDL